MEVKTVNRLCSVLLGGPDPMGSSSQAKNPDYKYRSYMDIPEEDREQEFAEKYSSPYPEKSS